MVTSSSSSSSSSAAALTGFVVGSAVTLLGVWIMTVQRSSFTKKQDTTKMTKKKNKDNHQQDEIVTLLPDEIRQEQLSRHTLYFGQEGMTCLHNASIVVVGVGGVGSHVAHMVRTDVHVCLYMLCNASTCTDILLLLGFTFV